MFSHSVLNTKAASSPASVASAASAASAASSPALPTAARVALVPSEASALLLQSLLRENNITMPTATPTPTLPPLSSATAPSNTTNTTTTSNSNTVNQDFCLFEADENSFDYPLFAESIKLQQQHQHHQQQLALHQAAFAASSSTTNMFAPSTGHSGGNSGGNSHGNTNPLCTPQTPSLDTMGGNLRSGGVDSFGFDGLATFFDEVSHCSTIHQGANADAFGQVIAIGMDGTCAGIMAQHHQQHNPVQSLVDTPFTPYLDTPYETPYLGDFGLGNDECTTATEVLFGSCDVQPTCQPTGETLMLFPAYGFDLSAFEGVDSAGYGSTIEPATLLMASPGTHALEPSPAMSDIHEGLPLPVAQKSPSPTGTFCDGSEDDSLVDEDENDLEVASASSPSSSCSVFDDIEDEMEEDDQEGEDPDDDEFIPSRPLAAAVSGFKRKALASFASGRHSMDGEALSSAAFKRTRPELASPYGGNAGSKKKRSKKASGASKKKAATKRFSCIHPGCERRFARLYNLHTHEKTHDPLQVRPFVCSVVECSKRFSRKHDLQRHEASVHKGERNYGCPTCGKPFSRQDGLRRHLSLKGNNGNNPCAPDIAEVDGSSSLSADASASEIDTQWSAT